MTKPDFSQIAFRVVQQATGQAEKPAGEPSAPAIPDDVRRQVMREFARQGGLKGGKARAQSMTASKRKEIAHKAAKARWKSY